jgi:hypothetical protein
MANKKFLLGMLAITLVFGLIVTACDAGGDPALNGTWKNTEVGSYIKFAAGAFELGGIDGSNYIPIIKGTYEARGGTLTITMTQFYDEGRWFTAAEVGASASELTQTLTYTISGRTLTLTGSEGSWFTGAYTKQ